MRGLSGGANPEGADGLTKEVRGIETSHVYEAIRQ
jgi:hypothetical protein